MKASRVEFGWGTNNEAEWQSLIAGLRWSLSALEDGGFNAADFALEIFTDSMTVVSRASRPDDYNNRNRLKRRGEWLAWRVSSSRWRSSSQASKSLGTSARRTWRGSGTNKTGNNMNATELFLTDGKPAGIFFCEKCRTVARTKGDADQCCAPYLCKVCGKDSGRKFWTICESCIVAQMEAKEDERFRNAEKLTEWNKRDV